MTFVMPLETLFSINCGVEALCAFNPNGPSCWSRRRGVKQLAGRTVPGGPPVGPAYGRNFLQLARQCGRQRSRRARHRGRRNLIGGEPAAGQRALCQRHGVYAQPRIQQLQVVAVRVGWSQKIALKRLGAEYGDVHGWEWKSKHKTRKTQPSHSKGSSFSTTQE